MAKPSFDKGHRCKACDGLNTVSLIQSNSGQGPAWITWCSCGVVWIGKDNKDRGQKVFNFGDLEME